MMNRVLVANGFMAALSLGIKELPTLVTAEAHNGIHRYRLATGQLRLSKDSRSITDSS
jgi:hypothetical protein